MVFLKECEMSPWSLNVSGRPIPHRSLACLLLGKGSLADVLHAALRGSDDALVRTECSLSRGEV